ncbi:MAG: HNH endonuclease family protein [Ekhidna sp.]|uniref:HNH endonuclease family protein n=1 Tax=Ekhidna sp. TaxID=2608089 RepID=UPI0032EC8425
MNENEFRNNLYGSIYQKSRAVLPMILLDYSEHLSGKIFDLDSLKTFVKGKSLTIEHILSQKPKFTLKTHGFKSNDEYLEFEHTFGNLTLLEKSLNSSVNNKNVYDKVTYYDKSKFKITRLLATQITHKDQFKKEDIEARTEEIANYLEEKWWC